MKQILLINDVVGYGKVGMAAMLPILSYMGVSAFNLPTALVSNTLNYGRFNILETTDYMRGVLPVWQELGFRFDAVCTGLMFSEDQARLVADYCRELREQGTTIFVDPVMGDAGELYNGITDRQVSLMREMISVADLIFPNYTEACYLTRTDYKAEGITRQEACELLDGLVRTGTHSAIITSCVIDGQHQVCGYGGHSHQYFFHDYEEIPGLFHGTGDIFSAVLIAHLLKQESLSRSTRAAMAAVSQLISRHQDTPDRMCGLPIEQSLDLL